MHVDNIIILIDFIRAQPRFRAVDNFKYIFVRTDDRAEK